MSIPRITPYPLPAPHEVPESRAGWVLDPGRAVLLIHDMQRYFLRFFPPGQAPATGLVHNIRAMRELCARHAVPVAYTAQPGGMSDEQRGLLKDFWGAGMTTDPADREVIDELRPAPADLVLTKWRYSALHRTELLDIMRRTGRDQLVVCGVFAHIGCLMTAADAFTNDVQPFLVADAVADFSLDYHRQALTWAAERCAAVPVTGAVLAALSAPAAVGARRS